VAVHHRMAATLAAWLCLTTPAALAEPPNLLAGRTIDFLVTGAPGDGYDVAARLFARHLEALLGQDTQVVVRNVTDGGGLLALQQLFAAEPDGSTIVMMLSGLLLDQLLEPEAPDFALAEATWIGKLTDSTRVLLAAPAAPYNDLAGLLAAGEPQTLAANRANSSATIDALAINALLGTQLRPVYGYDTSGKVMAMLRGEVLLTTGTASSLASLIQSPGVTLLLFIYKGGSAAHFGAAPTLAELAPPEGRRIVELLDTVARFGRLMLGPPGLPPDVTAAWRDAFDRVTTDPVFLAEAKALKLEMAPLGGAEVGAAIRRLFADSEGLRAEMNRLLDCGRARAEGSEAGC